MTNERFERETGTVRLKCTFMWKNWIARVTVAADAAVVVYLFTLFMFSRKSSRILFLVVG